MKKDVLSITATIIMSIMLCILSMFFIIASADESEVYVTYLDIGMIINKSSSGDISSIGIESVSDINEWNNTDYYQITLRGFYAYDWKLEDYYAIDVGDSLTIKLEITANTEIKFCGNLIAKINGMPAQITENNVNSVSIEVSVTVSRDLPQQRPFTPVAPLTRTQSAIQSTPTPDTTPTPTDYSHLIELADKIDKNTFVITEQTHDLLEQMKLNYELQQEQHEEVQDQKNLVWAISIASFIAIGCIVGLGLLIQWKPTRG